MVNSAEQDDVSPDQKSKGPEAQMQNQNKSIPLAQLKPPHENGGQQYLLIESKKKKQVINISSSEGENQAQEKARQRQPTAPNHSNPDHRNDKTKKIKKAAIKCQLCKASGKKSQMKACISCKNSFHIPCIQIQNSVPKRYQCDKCRFQKQLQKKEIQHNLAIKKQAEKIAAQKQKQRQIQKELQKQKNATVANGNAAIEKGLTRKSQKQKKRDQYIKRLNEFALRYPYYVQDDKIKYPVNDKLLVIYRDLFENIETSSSTATNNKTGPQPQAHPTIPAEQIADVLQIQNFFQTFKEQLKQTFPIFTKIQPDMDKLYKELDNELIDRQFCSMIYCLIRIYLTDIFDKNKTDNVKMLNENCFFTLLTNMNESEDLKEDVIVLAAEEIVRYLGTIPSMKKSFEGFKYPQDYTIKSKIYILVNLIKGLSEVDTFHEFVAMKSQKMQLLTKEKGELVSNLKVDEADNLSNKEKIKEFNTVDIQLDKQLNKNDESGTIANSRQITREKDKNQKKIQKLTSQKSKSQTNIKEIKAKISQISKNIPFITSLVIFLGKDKNESEYFFYRNESHRIYCKYHNYLLDDSEELFIFEGRATIMELNKSLNVKGSQQKHLFDMMSNFLKEDIIRDLPKKEDIIINEEEASQENYSMTQRLRKKASEKISEHVQDFQEEGPQMLFVLDRQAIVEKILRAEQVFSTYLAIKSLQWTSPLQRDNFIANIKIVTELQQIKQLLIMMQESFLFVEPASEDINKHSGKHVLDSDEEEQPMEGRRETKKKSPVRLWGINSERIKQYWVKYLEESIDLKGLWICANILKNYVDRYVRKKMEYLEEQQKKQEKLEKQKEKQRHLRKQKEREKETYNQRNYISNDYDRDSQRMNSRDRSRDDRSQNQKNRKKRQFAYQSESSDLAPLRPNLRERKKRKVLQMDSQAEQEEEQYQIEEQDLKQMVGSEGQEQQGSDSEDRCEICNEYGEMICCDTCPKVYHTKCLKLTEVPEGEWNCLTCLEDLTNKRQTRSRVRKLTKGSSNFI